jgi:hypothetical protein
MGLETSSGGNPVIIDVPLPEEPDLMGIDLLPEDERSPDLPESGDLPDRVSRLVAVGRPLLNPIDADQLAKASPHINAYLLQHKHSYEAKTLAFPCSFVSRSHPLVRAAVAVSLTSDGQAAEDTAVAWCLQPDRVNKPVLGHPFKLSLNFTVPPKASVEVGSPEQRPEIERYIILAYGEGTPDPEWLFRRTGQHDFDGLHWLGMVVMFPRNAPATARFALTAAIRHKKIGIVPYSADLPEQISSIALNT